MPNDSNYNIEPFFYTAHKGERFYLHFYPEVERTDSHGILIVPPFAEEMNKFRPTMSKLCRRLANLGYHCLIFDLYGTGDSDGDAGQAGWAEWIDDVYSAYQWMKNLNLNRISVCAIRTGALLINDLCATKKLNIQNAVLWQPVISGELFLSQFLRLKTAADLTKQDGKKDTVKSLIDKLVNGKSVEVAGYKLSSSLAIPMRKASLKEFKINADGYYWLESNSSNDQKLSYASNKVVEKLILDGFTLAIHAATEEPVWHMQETTIANEFISATEAIFA